MNFFIVPNEFNPSKNKIYKQEERDIKKLKKFLKVGGIVKIVENKEIKQILKRLLIFPKFKNEEDFEVVKEALERFLSKEERNDLLLNILRKPVVYPYLDSWQRVINTLKK